MARKFKSGNYVMLKPFGIPMTVTMYAHKNAGFNGPGQLVYVTWKEINGRIKTGKFKEDLLVSFPFKEWKITRLA